MKVSRDYISKLDSREKNDSDLCKKKGESFQNERLLFFTILNRGVLTPELQIQRKPPNPLRAYATDLYNWCLQTP